VSILHRLLSSFRSIFLQNLGLKLLSIFIGFFMWFFVSSEQTVERIMEVPVEIINKPADLEIANNFTRSVLVQVQSPQLGREESFKAITATLDLHGARKGENVILLTPDSFRTASALKITNIRPSTITVLLDSRLTLTVPVRVRYSGRPASQYVVYGVSALPERVNITGPESHVRNVAEVVTQNIDIQDLRERVVQFVNIRVESPFVTCDFTDRIRVEIRIGEKMVPLFLARQPIHVHDLEHPYTLRQRTADIQLLVPQSLRGKLKPDDLEIYIRGADVKPGVPVQEMPIHFRVLNPAFQNLLKVERLTPAAASLRLRSVQ